MKPNPKENLFTVLSWALWGLVLGMALFSCTGCATGPRLPASIPVELQRAK